MAAGELGLYIHLPFCPSRCPYCDFSSQVFEARQAEPLLAGLALHWGRRLEPLVQGRPLATLYIGGGTPSMWPVRSLARLLGPMRPALAAGAEVSLEANPGTLGAAKLALLRGLGVNRLSIGAQSFQPALLATLGRRHSPADTVRAVRQARAAGFGNIGLDLIYGLPGQTTAMALADLEAALALGPDHLSLYELTLGPATPFGRRYAKGRPPLPGEDQVAEMEQALWNRAEAAGLARYEVSNFARPGRACRHNQATWRGADYLALGPGAHGHLTGVRWANHADVGVYLAELAADRPPTAWREALTPRQRALELFMLGLRTTEGVRLDAANALLGEDAATRHAEAIAELRRRGWARLEQGRLRPTPAGLAMADAAAALFVD